MISKRHSVFKKKRGLQRGSRFPSYRAKITSIDTNSNSTYDMLSGFTNSIPVPPPVKKKEVKFKIHNKLPPRNSIKKYNSFKIKKSYAGTGKDITTHKENKTVKQIKEKEEAMDLASVDPEIIQEATRKLKSGEALYNSLVQKTRKKRLPKSVTKRIKKLKRIEEGFNPDNSIMDVIYGMK